MGSRASRTWRTGDRHGSYTYDYASRFLENRGVASTSATRRTSRPAPKRASQQGLEICSCVGQLDHTAQVSSRRPGRDGRHLCRIHPRTMQPEPALSVQAPGLLRESSLYGYHILQFSASLFQAACSCHKYGACISRQHAYVHMSLGQEVVLMGSANFQAKRLPRCQGTHARTSAAPPR